MKALYASLLRRRLNACAPKAGKAQARRTEAGFLAVEAIMAVLVSLVLLAAGTALWSLGMGELRKRAVAQQLGVVAQAAQQYARGQGFLQSLTPGAAALAVSTDVLSAAGLLPPLPAGQRLTNAWQQEYTVYYYVPAPQPSAPPTLTVLVLTTGGEAASEKESTAAAMAGAGGGVVQTRPGGDVLHGTGGGYAVPLGAAPMRIPSPGVGHVGYYVSLDDAALLSDTLYRVAVPGRPELNQMQVDLDMREHSLMDVKSVQFNAATVQSADLTTICGTTAAEMAASEGKVFFYTASAKAEEEGLYACRAGTPYLVADAGNAAFIRTARTVSDGTRVEAPACPPAQTPFITVSPGALPTGMSSGDTVYSSYTGTGSAADPWIVHLARYDKAGNALPTDGGSISVLVSCSR